MTPEQRMALGALARMAAECMMNREPVTIWHEPGWERNGMPLPIKKGIPDEDGSVTQDYRPMAILEYVEDTLQAEEASARKAAQSADQA